MRRYVVWFQYSKTLHHFLIVLLTSVGLLTHLNLYMPLNSLLNWVLKSVLNRKAYSCFSFSKVHVGNCSLSLLFIKCYLKASICQTPSWVKRIFFTYTVLMPPVFSYSSHNLRSFWLHLLLQWSISFFRKASLTRNVCKFFPVLLFCF